MTDAPDDDREGAEAVQLRQLRAVWIEMRDAQPPERGLAALMAAAGQRADQLRTRAEPSRRWWQRLVEVLRRPPVLALATILLLIGGVVLLDHRGQVQPRGAAEQEIAPPPPVEVPLPRGTLVAGGQALGSSEEPPSQAVRDLDEGPGAPGSGRPSEHRPARSGPPVNPGGSLAGLPSGQAGPALTRGDSSTLAVRGEEAAKVAEHPSATDMDDARSADAAPTAQRPPPDARDLPTSANIDPSLQRSVEQCEGAAKRGDCARVRTCAAELAKVAPAVYRARVAKSPGIARCLN